MGAGFVRRYTSQQPLDVLLAIEGVVIIDTEPPSQLSGLGTGAVCEVGEMEDGPFNTPTEVFSGLDYLQTFGGFGFTYGGVPSCNPCARARYADATLTPEYWNGNAFIALAKKKFARLFLVRVDTSVGAVRLQRLPQVTGNANPLWSLTNSYSVEVQLDTAAFVGATFTGAVAALTSAAGTYPTTFTGGQSMNVTIDENTDQQIGPVDIVFESGDQSHGQVIARINATLGYTAATDAGGGETTISGRVKGKRGSVIVNSVSGAIVTTATGFSAAEADGTGNVNQLTEVTFLEVKSVIEAAVTGTRVELDDAGNIRIAATSASRMVVQDTGGVFGFVDAGADFEVSRASDGFADLVSEAGSYPTSFGGGESLTLGFDVNPDVDIVFTSGDQTRDQVIARINSTLGATYATAVSTDRIKLAGLVNGGQVRVVSATSGVLTTLGLSAGVTESQGVSDTPIPAGFRVRDSAAHEWVTMQTLTVPVTNPGPFTIKVRPGTDDGTAPSASGAAVTVMVNSIPGLALSCTNPSSLSAALTESQIDAAYQAAMDTTLSMSAVTKDTDIILSARQSNALRIAGRLNALTASFSLRGRRFIARPPLGTTTRAQAKSNSQPGVGVLREERVWYAFPGVQVNIPQIATRGSAGGAGFTDSGNIDVGFDAPIASTASQLAPEENPGQLTAFMDYVLGIEAGNPDVQNLQLEDYESFRANGIMAPRVDSGTCVIQSGVSSVDPAQHPSLVPCTRSRFADYVSDTLAQGVLPYSKKRMSRSNRISVFGVCDGFLNTLLSPLQPDQSRIDSYALDAKSGNSAAAMEVGVFRLLVRVKMDPDMLDIVLDMQVGPTVSTTGVNITQTQ